MGMCSLLQKSMNIFMPELYFLIVESAHACCKAEETLDVARRDILKPGSGCTGSRLMLFALLMRAGFWLALRVKYNSRYRSAFRSWVRVVVPLWFILRSVDQTFIGKL
jgi:hypothetical protein